MTYVIFIKLPINIKPDVNLVRILLKFAYCIKMSNQTLSMSASLTILFLIIGLPNFLAIFRRNTSNAGVECRGYEKEYQFSTNISLYLGTPIGTRM